jgi:hypothetical protein
MRPECQIVEISLIDYLEHRVPDRLREKVEKHLRGCTACADLVQKISLLWREFDQKKRIEPPPTLWTAIQNRLEGVKEKVPVRNKILFGLKRNFRPAAVLLLLLAGIFFGYHLGYVPDASGRISSFESAGDKSPEEMFVKNYLKDFQDIPDGSMADVYMGAGIKNEEKP